MSCDGQITEAQLYKALLWLADIDDGQPVIIAYGVPHLAAHLAAILNGECWDPRCPVKHTRQPATCLLGRADVVLDYRKRQEAAWQGLRPVHEPDTAQ